jgi:hypothetical protein
LSTIVKRFLNASSPQSQAGLQTAGLRNGQKALLRGGSALALIITFSTALTFALGTEPAAARTQNKALHREADRKGSEPFGNVPKGPVQIFVSIDQQKLHLYSDGTHVADTSVATGVPRLPTPTGVFSVIQKQVFHRSNLYSDAPMPFMQRITWSGVALHEGENIGHPASHGCIRMPGEFAARLYKFTRVGARVIVAKGELKPVDFADPHLFVHKDIQTAATPDADALKTAQSADPGKASDANLATKQIELGLRGTGSDVPTSFVVAASDDIKRDVATDAAKADTVKSDPPHADAAKPAADDTKTDAAKSDPPAAANAGTPAAPSSSDTTADAATASMPAITPVIAAPETPPAAPAPIAPAPVIKKTPIAIFVSRKEKKVYVRQDFEPVFEEAITIEHPEQPMGTIVFTALELLPDNMTFRWNVVTLPGEAARVAKSAHIVAEEETSYYYDRYGFRHVKHKRMRDAQPAAEPTSPQTPQEVLARIDLPQDAIDFISQRMVPGSSLIVSDHGLGEETGEGTDFIVVTR